MISLQYQSEKYRISFSQTHLTENQMICCKYSIKNKEFCYNCNRRFMNSKKKSDLTTALDDLRCQDPKKRLSALSELREVAAALGPARVRGQLIAFLAQFLDDDENIVMELLAQLQNFTSLVGGAQQEKCLIPLLLSFCKTDQKKPAFKACSIIQRILVGNKELAIETIKKMMKTQMTVAKECGAQLIVGLLPTLQSFQSSLVELYLSLIFSESSQLKIIGSKYLHQLLRGLKSKEQVGKMLDSIYNEGDQLAKIYALKALIEYYDVSSNACLTKFKNLSVLNSWRINIKICDAIDTIALKTTKPHFKLIFEPILLKFMISSEPQLRASSSKTLAAITKNMSEQEIKSKLIPAIKKLASDSVDYVKVQLSKNVVPLCAITSTQIMNQCLFPIIFGFIKDSNSQISLGVVKSFDYLSTRMSRDMLDERIIRPLLQQLSTDNWRIKCQIIEILRGFLVVQTYLTEPVLKILFSLTEDRIDAVRLKANQLIIDIVLKNSKEWCDQWIIPKISSLKENNNYIKRQNLLQIMEKTAHFVSEKTLKDVYQNAIISCLADKVPNVRYKTILTLKAVTKLSGGIVDKHLQKLKDDKDMDIREMVKKIRG